MTIGDKSAQSYGWKHKLDADVNEGESVVVSAPGLDLSYTDTEHADVTLISNGAVWRTGKGKVEVVFEMNEDDPRATVTNSSGMIWPVGDEIYLFCPHLLAEGANEWDLKGQIWDLQQRVSALEGATMQGTQKYTPPKEPEAKENHPKAASAPLPAPAKPATVHHGAPAKK